MSEKLAALRRAFLRRWARLKKKSEARGLILPDREALWQKLVTCYRNGFRCAYCGRPMMIKDPRPAHGRSFSFDHRRSLYLGGNNDLSNFAIVCYRCNIVKGTMTDKTYLELLRHCPPGLLDRVFREIWAGRLADKLDREGYE